jgi:acetyltransferase
VALVGASNREGSVGAVTARNLLGAGFPGEIFLVNRRPQTVQGRATYTDIASLPHAPDLAVICTPSETVPGLVAELAARGTRGAVIITAGLGAHSGPAGAELHRRMFDAARPHLMRIVGPNCLGILMPPLGLNASFAHMTPAEGDLAFVAQSGAILTAVIDWAAGEGLGFSHVVSLGDMADVDFGDILDYLAVDPGTRAVLLYAEAITSTRKFMSAARACARLKPVIVIKTGRHAEGARAAASHTGAMAGTDAVIDAAFRRAGMLRVLELHELFDAVETLERMPSWHGDRLAILTNGGGAGVLAVDALMDGGGHLARVSSRAMERLDTVLPDNWSRGNPVDIIGDAPPVRYAQALDVLLDDDGVDAVLALNCPTAVASSTDAARAVIDTAASGRKPVLAAWLGDSTVAEARRLFVKNRVPSYSTPERAVQGFLYAMHYHNSQDQLLEVPPTLPEVFTPDRETLGKILHSALAGGRTWLTAAESRSVLAAYTIPVVGSEFAATPEAAADAAARLGVPVALKIVSPDIVHKSDVGGVSLDLATPEAVRAAAEEMRRRVAAARSDARHDGFTVEPMVHRPGANELIIGMNEDPQFGPVLMFGQGGTAVEAIGDTAFALPPLNIALAHRLIASTRVARLLQGYRDHPPAAIETIAATLVKVSHLVADWPEITELDINPLLADSLGVLALDARIRVQRPARSGTARFAIRPYPRELETRITLRDGRFLDVRPVRPEDGHGVRSLFERLLPEDIRLRFFAQMKVLPASLAVRLTQIDYDREMTFVATSGGEPQTEILALVRLDCDPDDEQAEFAILVRSDMKGRGIGHALMNLIIDHARKRRVGEVFGQVLADNGPMLELCRDLGFVTEAVADDDRLIRVSLKLERERRD